MNSCFTDINSYIWFASLLQLKDLRPNIIQRSLRISCVYQIFLCIRLKYLSQIQYTETILMALYTSMQ